MVIKVKIRTQRFKASSDYLIDKAEHFNFYVSYSRKGALKIERHKTKVKKKKLSVYFMQLNSFRITEHIFK